MLSTLLHDFRATSAQAMFNGLSRYRLEGDLAHLSADLSLSHAALQGTDWALQLWACPEHDARRIKLAEMPLERPAGSAIRVEGTTPVSPSAAAGSFRVALALASGRNGVFSEIHDLVDFTASEQFVLPRFTGLAQCDLAGEGLCVRVPQVSNPRAAGSLSGSLEAQLWALDAPYAGEAFSGTQLAAATLGVLGGGESLEGPLFALADAAVPRDANLVLMLREWTPLGLLTRDFRSLALPQREARECEPARSAEVQAVPTPEAAPVVAVVGVKAKAKAEAKAEVEVQARTQPEAAPAPVETAPAPVKASASAKTGKTRSGRAARAAAPQLVSVNTAAEKELAAVKGLTNKIAAQIVAGRPFKSLDALVELKGMGPKLLERVRDSLSV